MRNFAHLTALLVGGFLTLGTLQAQQPSQEGRPSFRANVDLVMLSVSVLDSDDLPIEGLFKEDFVVVEDDVEQELAIFLSPEEAGLDIALLMDVSDSMGKMEEAAKSSALTFLDQLSDDDCVFLLRFRQVLGPGMWGSPRNLDLRATINGTAMTGGTALHDAVAEGFRRLDHDLDHCWPVLRPPAGSQQAQQRRPALVVVTDGIDQNSVLTFDDLLSIARQAEAPFLPVGLGRITHARVLQGRSEYEAFSRLEGLARITGGQFIKGGRGVERLNGAYEEVLRWLRSYYLVGYHLPSTDAAYLASELPTWHEIEVRVRRPGYRVHTREGYYRSPIDVVAADRHVQAGIDHLSRGETAEALVELDLALQSDPYSWEAHYHSGKALMLTGRMQEAQRALLSAAGLGPGRGDVHKFACRVSLALEDYETAWDQAIRAQQAGIDTTVELTLLRQRSAAPANLEERLRAPRIYIDHYRVFDLVEQAVMRRVSLVLARELAEEPEIGLIDREALADYRLFLNLKKLAEDSPRKLEADLELWESADNVDIRASEELGGKRKYGKRLHRQRITLSDVEDLDLVAAELAPHIGELRERLSGRRR